MPRIKEHSVVIFARLFKAYINAITLITAAVSFPVTSLHLIPTFHAQTGILSFYTCMFCTLLVCYIFFMRGTIKRWLFKSGTDSVVLKSRIIQALPLLLILLSFTSAVMYHSSLYQSVSDVSRLSQQLDPASRKMSTSFVLETTDLRDIPDAAWLITFYIGMFAAAESALIVMRLESTSRIRLASPTRRRSEESDDLRPAFVIREIHARRSRNNGNS